jgi:acyl dehydratase
MQIPLEERRFEDYLPGDVHDLGTVAADETELIEFARRFDPQPLHTDNAWAAKHSEFGGVIASGWYTGSLTMRLYITRYQHPNASLASPGLDELRWLKPVRPGDVLTVRATVTTARRSRSKPDRGVVTTLIEVFNQHGVPVMTMKAMNLLRCRTPL